MNRPIKLSSKIVVRIPQGRRVHSLANLQWVVRNIKLSNTERDEVIQAIKEVVRESHSELAGFQSENN